MSKDCMTCSGTPSTGTNKPYTPAPKNFKHNNLSGMATSGSQNKPFGSPKVIAKFSGRKK